MEIDEGTSKDSTNDNPLFDKICSDKLNKIFSENSNWIDVANHLQLQSMIKIFEQSNNPSQMLLYCIEVKNFNSVFLFLNN